MLKAIAKNIADVSFSTSFSKNTTTVISDVLKGINSTSHFVIDKVIKFFYDFELAIVSLRDFRGNTSCLMRSRCVFHYAISEAILVLCLSG